jgi:uncharacterized protein (DUF2336 family)
MIVRDFLDWVRTAPAGKRAEATSALARAYLYSDLSPDDLGAAEGAMLMLLDDPSPLVRRALADALAASPSAPPAIVLALAADHPDIAAPVLALSPLFVDADLVDAVATGTPAVQTAIASRAALPRSVAAAIAEVGTEESCLALLQNHDADIAPFSIDRIVERHGHLAAVRELTLARDDLSVATRQILVAKLSQTLAGFVAEREWLGKEQAWRIAREACERATVALAAETPTSEVGPLIRHLRGSGQLNAGLILRALLSGNIVLFEEALAGRYAGRPRVGAGARPRQRRAAGAVGPVGVATFDLSRLQGRDRGHARGWIRRRARRHGPAQAPYGRACAHGCGKEALGDVAPLLTLLRRFATEAAREEARLFCDELVAEAFDDEPQSAA